MNMDLKRLFLFLVLLLFTALSFLTFAGCGAKKFQSQKNEENSIQDFSVFFRKSGNSFEILDFQSNLKMNSNLIDDEETETTTITKTYSPINSNATATFVDENGKKKELNNTNYTEERKTEKNKRKSEKSEKSEKVGISKLEKNASSKSSGEIHKKYSAKKLNENVQKDQKQWQLPFWLWLLLALILFLLLAYLNKKFGWLKYVTAFVSGMFQFRKK